MRERTFVLWVMMVLTIMLAVNMAMSYRIATSIERIEANMRQVELKLLMPNLPPLKTPECECDTTSGLLSTLEPGQGILFIEGKQHIRQIDQCMCACFEEK